MNKTALRWSGDPYIVTHPLESESGLGQPGTQVQQSQWTMTRPTGAYVYLKCQKCPV